MMSMRTSLTVALLSVMAVGLATGCSSGRKVVETFCQTSKVVYDPAGMINYDEYRFLLFDDGSIEVLRDENGEAVSCGDGLMDMVGRE